MPQEWQGPRDQNGYPVYAQTYTITISDADGRELDEVEVANNLEIPSEEWVEDTILDNEVIERKRLKKVAASDA